MLGEREDEKFVIIGKKNLRYTNFFSNLVGIFANHGDRELNRRILERLGYKEFYATIKREFSQTPFPYVLINLTAILDQSLRVATNLFGENTSFAEFY